MVYAKNKTKQPCLIELGMVYDKNKIEQWRDQSYRSSLR